MVLELVFTIVWVGSVANAYNILIIHPTPSYSHQLPAMALTEALVNRGHRVFVISPNRVPELEKNYTFVDISSFYNLFKDEGTNSNESLNLQRQFTKWEILDMQRISAPIMASQFKMEPVLNFFRQVKDEAIAFDVSLIETMFPPWGVGLTRLLSGYKTPIIGVQTMNGVFLGEDDLGSILHLSFLPSLLSSYSNKMNMWQKIENWVSHHYIRSKMMDAEENAARTYFRETHGPGSEALVDGCWSNFSQVLVSSNYLYHYPRMLGPNVAEVGPLHIKPPGKLPQKLQDWLDGAEKGVIYFSLGSNMKSKSLPENVRANFLKIFKELPSGYRVLWKWELDGKIPGQSDNILAQKWLPQQSVLAHPKVKLFLTQGGLQSFQETVHFGVPVVAIPWFADQESNAAKIVNDEIGTRIRPQELHSYEKIKSAIEAGLHDERYTKNMKRLSAISKEFTAQATNKSIFWVEHIAKYGHAHHLRPSTIDATYFQFFCFDILAVFLTVSVFCLFTVICIFKVVLSAVSSASNFKIKLS